MKYLYKGKGKVVKFYEERSALADSLNVCKNALVNMEILSFSQGAKLLDAPTGIPNEEKLRELGLDKIIRDLFD